MIPWVRLATAAAVLGGVFAWGWHFGAGHVQTRLDALISAQNEAVVRSQAEIIRKEAVYAHQLSDAASEHERDLADLAAIRALPGSGRLRCHTETGSGGVPQVPATPGHNAAPGGVIPAPVEFDPSAALTTLADRADDTVEACRVALGRWPR